jgi:hypothetical protein
MNSKQQKRNERLRSNIREFGHERISSRARILMIVVINSPNLIKYIVDISESWHTKKYLVVK